MVFFWWCSLETKWLLPFWLNKALLILIKQCQGFLLNVASGEDYIQWQRWAAATGSLHPKVLQLVKASVSMQLWLSPVLCFCLQITQGVKRVCFAFLANGKSNRSTQGTVPLREGRSVSEIAWRDVWATDKTAVLHLRLRKRKQWLDLFLVCNFSDENQITYLVFILILYLCFMIIVLASRSKNARVWFWMSIYR